MGNGGRYAGRGVDGLFHCKVGGGPPMLVVHGGMGWDHTYLRPGLDPLADRLALVYVDLSGNGRSARPETEAGWAALSIESWAEDLEQVRLSLGAERVLVFGHSLGGAVAQEYALRHPERVAGLVLCSTYPAFDYAQAAAAGAMARATPEQRAILERALTGRVPDDVTFAALGAALLPIYFHRPDAAVLRSAFADLTVCAAAFNRSFHECLPRFSTVDRLPALRAPTLIVSGDDDWIAPPTHGAERLGRLIPDATVAMVGDCGHFPFVERPERFQADVRAWLDRVLPVAGVASLEPAAEVAPPRS